MADTAKNGHGSVVPVAEAHHTRWQTLYADYAAFYEVEQTEEMRRTVWSWLMDPAHELCGLIALDGEARPIGLAHYRPFTRPLAASTGGYLDDLFVAPEQRGTGAAQALVDTLTEEARRRGWTVIRWITRDTNYRARALYDRVATRCDWLTYDIPL